MTLSLAQTKPIVAALRQTALFAHVPLRALTSLAEQATELQFKQGDSVYEAGVIADAFYVVRSGRLQDYGSDAQGKPTLRRQLRAGDTFGETAVVLGQETRSRVLVGEATTLARIGAPELHAALAKSTAFRRALYSAAHPELEAIHAAATAHDDHNVDLVALHAPLGWPLEKLAAALGED